jgi:hypothetical protein
MRTTGKNKLQLQIRQRETLNFRTLYRCSSCREAKFQDSGGIQTEVVGFEILGFNDAHLP